MVAVRHKPYAELTFYTTCQNRKRMLDRRIAVIIVTKVYEVC